MLMYILWPILGLILGIIVGKIIKKNNEKLFPIRRYIYIAKQQKARCRPRQF